MYRYLFVKCIQKYGDLTHKKKFLIVCFWKQQYSVALKQITCSQHFTMFCFPNLLGKSEESRLKVHSRGRDSNIPNAFSSESAVCILFFITHWINWILYGTCIIIPYFGYRKKFQFPLHKHINFKSRTTLYKLVQ